MYKIKLSPYAKIFYTEWLLDSNSYRYNLTIDQTLHGNFDADKLRVALKRYVQEHVILNSHIQDIDGIPHWIPNTSISELEYCDHLCNDNELRNYVNSSFDLYSGPLYRFRLLRINNDSYRFIVVMHHIVMDGSSALDSGVFEAISDYYNDDNYLAKYSIDEQIKLITDLSDNLTGKVEQNKDRYKEFWQQQLSDVENTDLRFLKITEPQAQTNKNNTIKEIYFSYGEQEQRKLTGIKSKYQVSPYIYGLSIFALLLHRYTGQERLAISYPIAIKEGLDFIYGAQINTNLIPYQFAKNSTVIDLFKQSQEFLQKTTRSEKYGYLPITDLIQGQDKRLLEIGFAHTYFREYPFTFGEITKVEPHAELGADGVAGYMLLFEYDGRSNEQKLRFRIRYDETILDEELTNNFVLCYQRLFLEILEDISNDRNKLISDYSLLTDEQYQKIVYEYNKTEKTYPNKTIHEIFEEQAAKTPNNIAIVFEDKQLTYQELNQKANQLAHYLRNNYDITPDDLIVLCLDRSEYMIIAILAVLKAGAAYVPIDPDYPEERKKYILEDTKAKVLIKNSGTELLPQKESQSITTTEINVEDVEKMEAISTSNPKTKVKPNNLAYVIYTSGTTGGPKGVMIEHSAVVSLVKNVTYIKINSSDSFIQFADLGFDATTFEIWTPLLNGSKLVIPNNPMELFANSKLFREVLRRNEITVLWLTKTLFDQLLLADKKIFASLRYLLVGGEALNKKLMAELINSKYAPKTVINGYGPTENTTFSCTLDITKKNIAGIDTVPIGIPLTNRGAYVLDASLNPLPIGAIGELYVGGSGLARGYLNNALLTKEKFLVKEFRKNHESSKDYHEKLYKTGDLVRMLPDGNLEYIGRNDSQVKIRGYRIELGEIENKLAKYPEIKQVVITIAERDNEKFLVAYYVADSKLDEKKIRDYLATQLPEYMVPNVFIYLPKLPLTLNGKLDRKALPAPEFKRNNEYHPPENEQEQLICKAFAKILGMEKIGIRDDFFTLGGNSIGVIQLVALLQADFDVKVADIFNFRTPAKIVKNTHFAKNVLGKRLEQVKLAYKKNKIEEKQLDEKLQKKIDTYLEGVKSLKLDYSLRKPITNVLLTGATGYLGCNILNQLLKLTDYNIFLLVRADSQKEAVNRINKKFQFYFDKTLDSFYGSRVFVIKADLEKNNLGLSSENYQDLTTKIDSVIHAAALVKHYGEYDKFYSANVQATINLLEFTKLTKLKDFHYISTYSVLNTGFVRDCEKYAYTEDDLPDNLEHWDNVYVKTKLQGERETIKYRAYRINSNIYRVGNLAFIAENYRTQENVEENAFFNWLKCLFKMQYIAKDLNLVEISPVDLTAQAIIKIFDKKQLKNNNYHVFNPHLFDLSTIFSNNRISPVTTLTMEQFIDNIAYNLSNNIYHDLIVKFLLRQGWLDNFSITDTTSIKVLQNRTRYILEQIEFKWFRISSKIFDRYLESLQLYGVSEMTKKAKIFEYLEIIAPLLPTPVYWLGLNQEYLGINELVTKVTGTLSYERDFAGKTPYDIYPKEMAEEIVTHHKEVIRTGKILPTIESIRDIATGEIKFFNATIAPLHDNNGEIIGTIGTSIDITAEKEAEQLKLETIAQKAQLEEQAKFKKIVDQVVHDIRSPLASLLMIVKACTDIPEQIRVALREAANSIGDIANNLLNKYRKEKTPGHTVEVKEPLSVSLAIMHVLTDKKYQYTNLPITFATDFCPECSFAFIEVESSSFKRMLSNLINNAVDAFAEKRGTITIKIETSPSHVRIKIQDNGKGIAPEVLTKIKEKIAVTADKQDGHGIGLAQVQEAVQRNNGTFAIESELGSGTTVTLTFPCISTPVWLASEIKLNIGDIVVILDDDNSIHGAWEARFKEYLSKVTLQHFTHAVDTINFINKTSNKAQIFLLTDFELLNQELNGLHVIEQTKVERSLLVTSHYGNQIIRELAIKAGTKILPKQLASEIAIKIDERDEDSSTKSTTQLSPEKVDLVILDDNVRFTDSLAFLFSDKNVDTYNDPQSLLRNLSKYPKDVIICTDHDLRSEIDGIQLAEQLHQAGYTRLYLLTGWELERNEVPDYLGIIPKGNIDKLHELISKL